MTFSIYALKGLYDEDGDFMGISNDPSEFTLIASKTISGTEIYYHSGEYAQKDYLCMPFDFDESVVVTATEEHPAFFFMLEGFHSELTNYFTPWQTLDTAPGSMNVAYMMSKIDFQAATGRPAYLSVKPLVYQEEGEYFDPASAFAFGLIAEFPWLTCNTEDVTLGANEESVKVALGSYYDGSDLKTEAPEGLVAEVAGQYDKCELTISREEGFTGKVNGKVTVKGPAVEVSVNVKAEEVSGIDEVLGTEAVATEAFDLFGRRINNPGNGVYIVKYNDGSVRKKVVVE